MEDRLTGQEPNVEFLAEMGFSSLEIERVKAIRARRRERTRADILPSVPRLFSEYTLFDKRCYREVFGDAAAEAIFGYGPWLYRFNTTCKNGHPKTEENTRKDGLCKICKNATNRRYRAKTHV